MKLVRTSKCLFKIINKYWDDENYCWMLQLSFKLEGSIKEIWVKGEENNENSKLFEYEIYQTPHFPTSKMVIEYFISEEIKHDVEVDPILGFNTYVFKIDIYTNIQNYEDYIKQIESI